MARSTPLSLPLKRSSDGITSWTTSRIQAVTEGREAMGSALIRLRADGKLYAGRGISTDIIGACIRAYLNALNKIVYEEEQA